MKPREIPKTCQKPMERNAKLPRYGNDAHKTNNRQQQQRRQQDSKQPKASKQQPTDNNSHQK